MQVPDLDDKPFKCSSCGKFTGKLVRSWCRACYQRWLKADRPAGGPPPIARTCQEDGRCLGCEATSQTRLRRGRCESCYRKHLLAMKDTATFTSMNNRRSRPLLDRLMERVAKAESGCWIFQGHINQTGYGLITDQAGRTIRAHRAMYMELVGPIPDGLHLDHLCNVRACVNPEHLEPVTLQVNTQRAVERHAAGLTTWKDRQVGNSQRTHCSQGHELTAETATSRKDGGVRCLLCERIRDRRRRAAGR